MRSAQDMMWKTRDGRKVRVTEMDDRHLLNSHRFLCNKAKDAQAVMDCDDNHESDRASAEQEYTRNMEVAEVLMGEIKKRSLAPLKAKAQTRAPMFDKRDIDHELGRCIVPDCGKWAVVKYPLVEKKPAFCSKHYDQPDILAIYGCHRGW